MAKRTVSAGRLDLYSLRRQRARRDWDLWSVAAFVVILLVGLWGLGR